MNKKKFDCVAMKHQAARRIYEKTKDLTVREKLAYWDKVYKEMLRQQSAAIAKQA
jgi:hypothetical protein